MSPESNRRFSHCELPSVYHWQAPVTERRVALACTSKVGAPCRSRILISQCCRRSPDGVALCADCRCFLLVLSRPRMSTAKSELSNVRRAPMAKQLWSNSAERDWPLKQRRSRRTNCFNCTQTYQDTWVPSPGGNTVEVAAQGGTDCVNDNDDR